MIQNASKIVLNKFSFQLNVILCPVLSASKELRNSIASLELEQNQQQPSFKVSALRVIIGDWHKTEMVTGFLGIYKNNILERKGIIT